MTVHFSVASRRGSTTVRISSATGRISASFNFSPDTHLQISACKEPSLRLLSPQFVSKQEVDGPDQISPRGWNFVQR